jgi:signal transduction histidine kinase
MPSRLEPEHLARLLEAGSGLMADLDVDLVLDRLLETARDLTGARYAALGILDERRRELEQFLTRGIDAETHRSIGDLPRGRGILGLLIQDPRPLRLEDVGSHPRSYGFPPGHPPMATFLGVPVRIRGETWGNLYLTEKEGGRPFTETDEASVMVLAGWAGIAIEHARLYEAVDARRDELERAVRGFEATATIARAIGAETDLSHVLELIVKRGRALIDARSVLILLRKGDVLTLVSGAGHVIERVTPALPATGSPFGEALAGQRAMRVDDVEREPGLRPEQLGVPDARAALLVPLVFRGRALGLLVAFDRLSGDGTFTADDEHVLHAFAASAATAVANAQTVEADRLRHSMQAAEEERRRWARELHDETLQALAGLKVLLSGAARRGDADGMRAAIDQAVEQVTQEIANLRSIIAELRPAALDELGLAPALTSLLEAVASRNGLELRQAIDLPDRRLAIEQETVVYRLVQEALSNVAKHARATSVDVEVGVHEERIHVSVGDDGVGFDPEAPVSGFGVVGMRERVALADGELAIGTGERGTTVRASLPLVYADGNVSSARSIA